MGRKNTRKIQPTADLDTNKSVTRQTSTRQLNIDEIFRPLVLPMKIFGILFLQKRQNTNFLIISHRCYCVSLAILLWLDAGRFMSIFAGSTQISDKLMGLCNDASFYLVLACTPSVLLFSLTRHFPNLIQKLSDYQEDYGFSFDPQKFRRTLKRVVIGVFVTSVTSAFAFLYLYLDTILKSQTSLLILNLTPFNTLPKKYMTGFFVVFYTLRMLSANILYISYTIYSTICYIFWKEYNSIASKLEEMINENDVSEIQINLEHFREQHQAVTNILNVGNNIVQHVPFIMYCFGIPMVCFTMYGVIKGSLESVDVVTQLNALVFVTLGIIFVTLVGSKVNSAAHEPLNSLFHINMDSLPDKVLHQVNIFATRLTGPPLGIDVYGLFVIDRSTVLMLFGTIITYGVIVLQL